MYAIQRLCDAFRIAGMTEPVAIVVAPGDERRLRYAMTNEPSMLIADQDARETRIWGVQIVEVGGQADAPARLPVEEPTPPGLPDSIGRRIAKRRSEMGFTQDQVASRLGVTKGAVGQYELGLSKPSLVKIPVLAEILGVTVEWLLTGGADDISPPEGSANEQAALRLMRGLDPARQSAALAMLRGLAGDIL